MRVELMMPANNEEKVKNDLLRILVAAKELGVPLDGDTFSRAWFSDNTRVCLASDGGKDVGIGIMAFGRRYYDAEQTASVLIAEGPARNTILEYLLDMARVLGARHMYYEARVDDTIKGEQTQQHVIEVQS